jgi:hypothetical protein
MRTLAIATLTLAATLPTAGAVTAGGPPGGPLTACPPDAIVSGTGCMDKYEASVWRVPNPATANAALVAQIRSGTATAELLRAGGANQLGTTEDDYAPCARNGQNCVDDIFAVSLPAVTPSAFLTWFQAQQACTNAGKRLPSNAEWQSAVAGTPDPGPDDGVADCNTAKTLTVAPTGSRSRCVSSRGAFDMVGNLFEWVADWVPPSSDCGAWGTDVSPTGDGQCLSGALEVGEPGALLRGGDFLFAGGAAAGPLAISGSVGPSNWFAEVGFRCAR